ncbi:MAG: radical SAM protein [Candidatus Aminicenantales bacterium]
MAASSVDVRELFRLPWTLADNAMTWLEPTRKCNITCDACFARNDPASEKSLSQVEKELDTLLRLRRCDAVLIAGGEPLTHPAIVSITRLVKSRGVKPVLVTNGVGLTPKLVHDLKQAGAWGITFHVDSHQDRPGWRGKSERELNRLRQEFADLLYQERGLVCCFNTTVFPDALEQIPDVVEWAVSNVKKVQVLTLIAVRMISPEWPFDFYAGGEKVDLSRMPFSSSKTYRNLTAEEIISRVKKVLPDFQLCAYLGGTSRPHSLKWSIGCRVGTPAATYGWMGPRSMEILQNVHHFWTGRYLAYTKPSLSRKARLLFLFGVFDPQVRRALKAYLSAVWRNPRMAFGRIYTQTVNILQPIDILPSGDVDTCDGCPNKTYWNGGLVSACRLDEYAEFGTLLEAVPRRQEKGR